MEEDKSIDPATTKRAHDGNNCNSPKPRKRRIKEEEPIVIEDSCDDSEIQFGRRQGSNCLDDTIPVESSMGDSIQDDSSDSDLPHLTMSSLVGAEPVPSTSTPVEVTAGASRGGDGIYRTYVDLINQITPDCSEDDDDDDDLQAAITQSLNEHNADQDHATVQSLLEELGTKIRYTDEACCYFNISRNHFWEGAMRGFKRKSYSPYNRMKVKFTDDIGQDEGAVDTGGPKREFLRLLMRHLKDSLIFEGHPHAKVLSVRKKAMDEDLYYIAGRMIAVSLVHGGPGPQFFWCALYNTLVFGVESVQPTIEDIANQTTKDKLEAILNATTEEQLSIAVDKADALATMTGAGHTIPTLQSKDEFVGDIIKFLVITSNLGAYQRLKAGLSTLNVMETVISHPTLFREVFVHTEKDLTVQTMTALFDASQSVSPEGSNKRSEESQVLSFWEDYLVEIQDAETEVTLRDILIFATGLDNIPPLGFSPSPTLEFVRDEGCGRILPSANTCGNVLRIPVVKSYELFKENMGYGIFNSPGFGQV
ncbi:G2/M phase-specific E3 ubiquitin-protein ligase-like isoform X2 [Ptychodera flava]|uniref:G2/M phase-specific E3 ubiquitin-protein ligase-like isoform X2 n=1 Tax=Ptychodera flava TaxID=63121 RepID=UPI00396A6259